MYKLVIGNKNYSSWSLRPWLLMKYQDIPFEEIKVPLYAETSKSLLLQYSPAGKVPVLQTEEHSIWDSLAICETIAEQHPDKHCWPQELSKRVMARSVTSEMHSSFMALRNTLPMNCRKKTVFTRISAELQNDVNRICTIWRECLAKHDGPFLFGDFCIADAFYAPVVLRFTSYGINVGDIELKYMQKIQELDALKAWISEGIAESETIPEAAFE
jgi:glutathione S-transferase